MIDTPGNDFNSQDPVIQCVVNCYQEAKHAKLERMIKNAINFNCYHLKQDWSHKQKGQSREFLPKVAIATEQLTSFIQQALLDINKWFEIQARDGVLNPLIAPDEMFKILNRQLEKNKIAQFMADTIKLGVLGSLMVVKVHGKRVDCPQYEVGKEPSETDPKILSEKLLKKTKPYWQLQLDLIRQEDWFPDPLGRGLYEIQRIEMDYYQLLKLAAENPDIYDMEQIKMVPNMGEDEEDQRWKKYRETNQNTTYQRFRHQVVIKEFWGTLISPTTGEVIHENIVCAIANNRFVIRKPQKNPFWHGESPFIAAPILRVPHSAWGKALMDAPTMHNLSMNEVYNLILDGGMASVFGVRQLREQWLANPEQVNDGIPPGTTLVMNSTAPPGAKVLERVDTGALPSEALQLYNLNDREFQQSALTNDTRLGVLPQRAVKATEIVASQNAITGLFNGIVKVMEKDYIVAILDKSWKVLAQYMNDLHVDEVKALIGEQRALAISNMSPKQIFAGTVGAYAYSVFGLSSILNKMNDFQKITALLQTIGASPLMAQEFQKKYSFTKLLGEIIKSLDINEQKIVLSDDEKKQIAQQQQAQAQAQAQGGQAGQPPTSRSEGTPGAGGAPSGQPNVQSQIPQVGNMAQQPMPRMAGITRP